jgi:serine phosphatase RsbU (regulator of sigma subunit)
MANKRMAEELQMASELQLTLLPSELPQNEKLHISSVFLPASEASGDLYDISVMPDGKIAFVQVDVSGHGVRSAMIGAMFKMSFQTLSKKKYRPSEFLARLNDDMLEVTPDADYLTIFCGIIDTDNMEIVYSNAGHPRPFLYRDATKEILELREGGMMVGIYPGIDYDEGRQKLEPGDKILAYTDGITEARDPEKDLDQLYGKTRLMEIFLNNIHKNPDDVLREIVEDVQVFQGTLTCHDDLSLLLICLN